MTTTSDFGQPIPQDTPCILRGGALDRYGYARARYKGWQGGAHRLAYRLNIGPIPDGYEVDHLCNVKPCINPLHLEAVPMLEHHRRTAARRTHCKNGHVWSESERIRPNGERVCIECDHINQANYRARKRKEREQS